MAALQSLIDADIAADRFDGSTPKVLSPDVVMSEAAASPEHAG